MDNKNIEMFGINLNIDTIPINYIWSYELPREEFENNNFYVWIEEERKNIICSNENPVALCDYLSTYLLKNDIFSEMEYILSPDMNYWFFVGYEQVATCLEEYPLWIQDTINALLEYGLIHTCINDDITYFCIFDIDKISFDSLPIDLQNRIKDICTKEVKEFWKEYINNLEDEKLKSYIYDLGPWGLKLYKSLTLE